MPLYAQVEIAIHLGRISSVKFHNKGWYRLELRVYTKSKHSTVAAIPYVAKESNPYGKNGAAHSLFGAAAVIRPEEQCYCSKVFHVDCEQTVVDLAEIAQFRLMVPASLSLLDDLAIFVEVVLSRLHYTNPGSTHGTGFTRGAAVGGFGHGAGRALNLLESQEFTLHVIDSKIIRVGNVPRGVHDYIEISLERGVRECTLAMKISCCISTFKCLQNMIEFANYKSGPNFHYWKDMLKSSTTSFVYNWFCGSSSSQMSKFCRDEEFVLNSTASISSSASSSTTSAPATSGTLRRIHALRISQHQNAASAHDSCTFINEPLLEAHLKFITSRRTFGSCNISMGNNESLGYQRHHADAGSSADSAGVDAHVQHTSALVYSTLVTCQQCMDWLLQSLYFIYAQSLVRNAASLATLILSHDEKRLRMDCNENADARNDSNAVDAYDDYRQVLKNISLLSTKASNGTVEILQADACCLVPDNYVDGDEVDADADEGYYSANEDDINVKSKASSANRNGNAAKPNDNVFNVNTDKDGCSCGSSLNLKARLNHLLQRMGIFPRAEDAVLIRLSGKLKAKVVRTSFLGMTPNEAYSAMQKMLWSTSGFIFINWDRLLRLQLKAGLDEHASDFWRRRSEMIIRLSSREPCGSSSSNNNNNATNLQSEMQGWNLADEHHFFLADSFPFVKIDWKPCDTCPATVAQEPKRNRIRDPNEHLVILVHGYHGDPWGLIPYCNNLITMTRNCHCILSTFNYQRDETSIEEMGARLAQEVQGHLSTESGGRVRRLSFIAHSLGGLVVRRALPRLVAYKHLLYTFVSLASPHLGFAHNQNKIVGAALWVMTRFKDSDSFKEMNLADATSPSETLLYKMCSDDVMASFKVVRLLGILQDQFCYLYSAHVDPARLSKYKPFVHDMAQELQARMSAHRLDRIWLDYTRAARYTSGWIGRATHIDIIDRPLVIRIILALVVDLF